MNKLLRLMLIVYVVFVIVITCLIYVFHPYIYAYKVLKWDLTTVMIYIIALSSILYWVYAILIMEIKKS